MRASRLQAISYWHRHSLRIEGHVTSIRIESPFLAVLQCLACRADVTINALLLRLHQDYLCQHRKFRSNTCFTSYLRVHCLLETLTVYEGYLDNSLDPRSSLPTKKTEK